MKRRIAFLLAVLMIVTIVVGCGSKEPSGGEVVDKPGTEDSDKTLRKNEIMRVGFPSSIASFSHSPLLVAKEMGYFDEEGIDIVFEQSYSSSATRMVAANQVEFSVPGPHLTVAGIEGGMDVISVYQHFPINIFGFAVMEDSPIKTIADLEGKVIGTMTPTTANQVIPIVEHAGIDKDSIEMIPIVDARLQQLSEKQVDAVWTWHGEWQQWLAEGQKVRFLDGNEVYKSSSNSLIANLNLVKEYPELIERFTRAFAKGCYFSYKNPRAAADIIITNWTSLLVDLDTAEEIVKTATNVMIGGKETMEGNKLGFHNEATWSILMDDYVKMGIVSKAIPFDRCYTNEFVDAANNWDRAEVDKDATNYVYQSK